MTMTLSTYRSNVEQVLAKLKEIEQSGSASLVSFNSVGNAVVETHPGKLYVDFKTGDLEKIA